MLVVNPASTCDVCLESYTGRSESAPYSIPCGHIFCFKCLQSLRQHICPLCRSPFEASDIRRLHVDCTDSHLNARRPPSPRRTNEPRIELPAHNALGLVEEIPRAVQLQRKISDLVLKSSLSSAVRERGLRELIQEVHTFLGSEPLEWHTDLRAEFLLFYRFTDLQARYQQLESSVFDLRTENNHKSQTVTDWERRYQDVQRSRARDQESARIVEASLRERLRIEELEWQRKHDFVSEECAKLRDELDKVRFSSPPNVQGSLRAPRRSTSTTQIYYVAPEGSASSARFAYNDLKGVTSGKDKEPSKTQDEADMFRYFNPDLFHLSPLPERLSLSTSKSSDSDEEIDLKKQRRRAPESPSRTNSTSSSISRASESAAALKPMSPVVPIRTGTGRQRSESNPIRGVDMSKLHHPGNQPEISSSAPSSYMYRAPSPTRALFPTTPLLPELPVHDSYHRDVARLYSLLEKQGPSLEPRLTSEPSNLSRTRNSGLEGPHSRPILPRSTSFQQTRSWDFGGAPSTSATTPFSQNLSFSSRRTHPHMQLQTSLASMPQYQRTAVSSPQTPTQVQASEAISPIQRTPPRPVLPRVHSYFHLYSPSPSKPVSPKENNNRAQPSLLRRGSLSSASAAAAQASGQSSPAVVSASSLRPGKSHARGLFGGQDSD